MKRIVKVYDCGKVESEDFGISSIWLDDEGEINSISWMKH